MRKSILFALLALAVLAVPAQASVQNIKLSGDIDTYWLVRDQFDLGIDGDTADLDNGRNDNFYQNLLFTQTRLRVDADLTDNVGATVALINERVWGEDDDERMATTSHDGTPANTDIGSNDVDLNLAYVTLREMLYSPLTVVIGRQNFAFGNSFVIDSAGSNNTVSTGGLDLAVEDLTKRTALDTVRMTFDYNPLTIDVIAAKVAADYISGGDQLHKDDVNLFGTNANYKLGDERNSLVEGYFWAKIDHGSNDSPGAGRLEPKADTVYMPGMRVATSPIKGLNLSAEVAGQYGNKTVVDAAANVPDNVRRRAMGAQVIGNYMLPFEQTAQWSPVLTTVYTFVSGDNNPNESSKQSFGTVTDREYYTAWDPMFENQAGGSIYNSLFDLTNAHIATIKLALQPIEDVTVWSQLDMMWSDKQSDDESPTGACQGASCFNMRQPDGTVINPEVTTNAHIGNETAIGVVYDYTEDVQFGGQLNWFIPGDLFHDSNHEIASQVLVHGLVSF